MIASFSSGGDETPDQFVSYMKLLLFILSLLLTITAANTKSWFREKYLEHTYDEYYHYSISRYRFGDNNRDICPDTHKTASFFAITGRSMNRKSGATASLPVCLLSPLYTKKWPKIEVPYLPPEAHYARLVTITVVDVIEGVGCFINYIFERCMILVSMIFASFGTFIMLLLTFGQ